MDSNLDLDFLALLLSRKRSDRANPSPPTPPDLKDYFATQFQLKVKNEEVLKLFIDFKQALHSIPISGKPFENAVKKMEKLQLKGKLREEEESIEKIDEKKQSLVEIFVKKLAKKALKTGYSKMKRKYYKRMATKHAMKKICRFFWKIIIKRRKNSNEYQAKLGQYKKLLADKNSSKEIIQNAKEELIQTIKKMCAPIENTSTKEHQKIKLSDNQSMESTKHISQEVNRVIKDSLKVLERKKFETIIEEDSKFLSETELKQVSKNSQAKLISQQKANNEQEETKVEQKFSQKNKLSAFSNPEVTFSNYLDSKIRKTKLGLEAEKPKVPPQIKTQVLANPDKILEEIFSNKSVENPVLKKSIPTKTEEPEKTESQTSIRHWRTNSIKKDLEKHEKANVNSIRSYDETKSTRAPHNDRNAFFKSPESANIKNNLLLIKKKLQLKTSPTQTDQDFQKFSLVSQPSTQNSKDQRKSSINQKNVSSKNLKEIKSKVQCWKKASPTSRRNSNAQMTSYSSSKRKSSEISLSDVLLAFKGIFVEKLGEVKAVEGIKAGGNVPDFDFSKVVFAFGRESRASQKKSDVPSEMHFDICGRQLDEEYQGCLN